MSEQQECTATAFIVKEHFGKKHSCQFKKKSLKNQTVIKITGFFSFCSIYWSCRGRGPDAKWVILSNTSSSAHSNADLPMVFMVNTSPFMHSQESLWQKIFHAYFSWFCLPLNIFIESIIKNIFCVIYFIMLKSLLAGSSILFPIKWSLPK